MIDTDAGLVELAHRIARAAWVALDTEADSLHAYPEKLCLLQISTPAGDELVDPLAPVRLEPLLESLARPELIMHGADYDLRLLRKHHQFAPRVVFDTMLAARLLGHRQFSLEALVARYLGVTLDKGPQKANWGRRPLTERMSRYARDDTHYLKPLADHLRDELEQQCRLSWHQETCARLVADCARPDPADADSAWRIKGSHRLSRPALAVLRALWHWRETEALAANRPPYFILSHETLVALAATAVHTGRIEPLIPPRFSERRRHSLLKAVRRGLALPPHQQPERARGVSHHPTEKERLRFRDLQRHRDLAAQRLGIDPALIASRALLVRLAHDWEKHGGELMNWQRQLLRP